MIATDLDRTLLRNDKTVSPYAASVFGKCRDSGIVIAFATARPVRTVKKLNLNVCRDAVIYHNGAIVEIDGRVRYRALIEYDDMMNFITAVSKKYPDMKISVEIDDVLYANFDVREVWADEGSVRTDFSNLPRLPAEKIILGTADRFAVAEIKKMLPAGLYAETADDLILMIMNGGAKKSTALKKIADHFGIALSDAAAFGDDSNDIGMLRECGAGVAMENASDAVKAAAKYVCGSNEDDGVAKWIEERILPR